MIIYSLFFMILNMFSLQVVADESAGQINPLDSDVVSAKKFRVDNQVGDVFVIVRKDGHMNGHPYIVELRASCGPETSDWKSLKVADSQSACNVVQGTEKLLGDKKELSVQIFEANAILYNVNSMKAPVQGKAVANDPQCAPQANDFKFSLADFCKKKKR